MPVVGRKPPAEGEKRINNHALMEWTEVEKVPFEGPWPDLPDTYSDAVGTPEKDERWNASTKRWWNTIKRMPHAALWDDPDWELALSTAVIHHRFLAGNNGLAGELRRREREMGTTADARRDLRIRYIPPSEGAPMAVVKSIDSVRDL